MTATIPLTMEPEKPNKTGSPQLHRSADCSGKSGCAGSREGTPKMETIEAIPIKCVLSMQGDKFRVIPEESVSDELNGLLSEFNEQLKAGADLIDARGKSFPVPGLITPQILQKIESALCCQVRTYIKLTFE